MAEVRTIQNIVPVFEHKAIHASLDDIMMSVDGEEKPFTLRQVTKRGYFSVDRVTAALHERIRNGALATFKIGPLVYYASPLAALTMKGPTFSSFTSELFKNAVWENKHRFNHLAETIPALVRRR